MSAQIRLEGRVYYDTLETAQKGNLVLDRLLDGFTGKLTSSKWAKVAKCSPDTALRDINDLVGRQMLPKDAGGGRNTSYSLADVLIGQMASSGRDGC